MGRGSGLQLFLYLKRAREVERGCGRTPVRHGTREAGACAHWGHARVDVLIVLPRETMEELLHLLFCESSQWETSRSAGAQGSKGWLV